MKYVLLTLASLSALTACDPGRPVIRDDLEGAQYWQRVSISDAAYQQGPKAQEMLNRDIANCVAKLKEMERLGSIREAIPADSRGRVMSPDEQAYNRYNSPSHYGGLYMENADFHDFEGCMIAGGWERVKHVPYDVAHTARKNYLKAHKHYDYHSRYGYYEEQTRYQQAPRQSEDPVFGDLNQ